MSLFSPDPWLAETLGCSVFRLAPQAAAEQKVDFASEMSHLAGDGDAFFYAKLPTNAVASCIELVNAGFTVIDTSITFSWRGPASTSPNVVKVCLATNDQHEAIARIAETCFRWSRFHLDPKIAASRANLIKRRWIENYALARRGSALYSASLDGAVVGFLAVLEAAHGARRAAIIDLIGVASNCQGRGVGAALVESFVRDWQSRADELSVGTQAANIQSLRFYEARGFRIAATSYVLHAHFRRGELYR